MYIVPAGRLQRAGSKVAGPFSCGIQKKQKRALQKMKSRPPFVALGSRLHGIAEVLTLGVKPNFLDYSTEERLLIDRAPVVLYPTLNYAQFFTTLGKQIFPSLETYLYADEKIKQSTLFFMLDIPHPRTRFYYQPQFARILQDFSLPFVAKIPRASSRGRGVFLISKAADLEEYLGKTKIAYIQEYLPHDRDLRVVLLNYRCITAYWRLKPAGGFKTNLHQGGTIDFADIPAEGLTVAEEYSRACRFNDVGLDFICSNNTWYLIEANMQYGREGLRQQGKVLKEIIREKLLAGELY
jgi:ribosomal protein S6--L-glutamate ligase